MHHRSLYGVFFDNLAENKKTFAAACPREGGERFRNSCPPQLYPPFIRLRRTGGLDDGGLIFDV